MNNGPGTQKGNRSLDAALTRIEKAAEQADDFGSHTVTIRLADLNAMLKGIESVLLEAFDAMELRELFDLRCKTDKRAIEIWQAAHPGNENIWPDRTDLVTWLLEQLEAKGGAA